MKARIPGAQNQGNMMKKIQQMPVHFLCESGKGFFVKQENGEETLPNVFAIMPDKYQRLSMSKAECQQDVDGRASIRLRKQMKYYG